jgi:hypothetical protein
MIGTRGTRTKYLEVVKFEWSNCKMSDVSVRSWVGGRVGRDESFLCPVDRKTIRLGEIEHIVVRSGRAIGGVEDVENEVSSL